MSSRFFITGGCGFFARILTQQLLEHGHTITLYDREEALENLTPSASCRFIKADILDETQLHSAIAGHDVVIHNAAVLPIARAGKDYWKVNVEGTQKVLEACQKYTVRKVIFISTSAVYGIPKTVPINESTPLTPLGKYGFSKYDAEQVCQKFKQKGLDITIIRPRTLVGQGRLGIFSLLFDRIRKGRRVFILGNGKNLFQLLSGRDLASACLLAAERPCRGEDFNLGSDQFGTINEDLSALIQHAGSTSQLTPLPALPARLLLTLLDHLRLSPLVDWHYKTPHKPFYFDISKAKKILGWMPQDGNQKMLCSTYDWYLKKINTEVIPTGTRHSFAVKPGLLK